MTGREDDGVWTSDEEEDDGLDAILQDVGMGTDKNERKREIVGGLAREWWFMADWMHRTRGCFSLVEDERLNVDPLRIGPDGSDMWISVSIANDSVQAPENELEVFVNAGSPWDDNSVLAKGHEWRFPMLREAMILQSLMVRGGYDEWIKCLVHIGGVKPPKYVHLNMDKPSWSTTTLVPKFSITIPPYTNPKFYEWIFLQEVFQTTNLSEDFQTGYAKMIKLLVSKRADAASMPPVPLKLCFAPQHVGYLRQLAVIRNIRSVVEEMIKQREIKPRHVFSNDLPAPPVFHLETIDLDFGAFSLHPSVLKAIEKLVATTGAAIGSLRLPSDPFNGDFDDSALRTAWASLVCTLFGHTNFRHDNQIQRFSTEIDHIDIPWMYTCTELCEPLFMAAKDARGVRSVRIDMNAQLHHRRSEACRYFGGLIGYAFFNAYSTCSIESLELGRLAASNRFEQSMVDVATSHDALGCLWTKICGLPYNRGASLNKEIILKRDTLLHPRWKLTAVKTPAPWTAFILFDDPTERLVDVYVPGFGLCYVDRCDIQNKRRRLYTAHIEQIEDQPADRSIAQDTRRLRTLAISLWPNHEGHDQPDPTDAGYFSVEIPYIIERLGSLIGDVLEGLAVDSQDANEWMVQSICKYFPLVRRLKLVGGSFGSLGLLMNAYQNGCRITSLELSGSNIPTDQFEFFLQFLISDTKGRSAIQQLSAGKDWLQDFRRQTLVLFQQLLHKSRELTYLKLHVDNCEQRHALQDRHGEFIPGRPLAPRNRLAFVSVRNHPTLANSPIAKLDEAVLQLVFEFAGAVLNRNVIVKRNTIIPVIRRLLFDF